MARPIKEVHRISQMISCYQKDLDFFEDHRGKLTLSAYLIEAGYHYAGDVSRDEKRIIELKEAKKRIAELENELGFEKLKNKKQAPTIEINEAGLIKFYQEKNMAQAINEYGSAINWQNLFDKNIIFLSVFVRDHKALQKWCMDYFRRNGQTNHDSPDNTAVEMIDFTPHISTRR